MSVPRRSVTMAPQPHDIGLHYLYVTSLHSFLPLSDSRAQVPTLCTQLPVTMLAVHDSLYPVHTHLIDGLIAHKRLTNKEHQLPAVATHAAVAQAAGAGR